MQLQTAEIPQPTPQPPAAVDIKEITKATNDIYSPDDPDEYVQALAAAKEIEDPEKYPVAPFAINQSEAEEIGLNSGSLELNCTDFVLPGKNGFDLSLTRRYSAAQSNTLLPSPSLKKMCGATWTIEQKCYCRDDESGRNRNVLGVINDKIGLSCGTTAKKAIDQAERNADAAWREYWKDQYKEGKDIVVEVGDNETHLCKISFLDGSYKVYARATGWRKVPFTLTRPNEHLTSRYGLGLGWGFGFPSIEVVSEANRKTGITYHNFLHLGDGRIYRIAGSGFYDYDLKDITFSSRAGTVGGRAYHYMLQYKDGRKAYFAKDDPAMEISLISLTAMTDRFDNIMYFNLSANGGSIIDTLGRTITLTKREIDAGYTMTWTLPDSSTVEYTIRDNLLTAVRDQAGRLTQYHYEGYQTEWGQQFCKGFTLSSMTSTNFGDNTVQIPYRPLTGITHPTGAQSRYYYEFFEAGGNTWLGYSGQLLLRRREDFIAPEEIKNRSDYSYSLRWMDRDASQCEYQSYIEGSRVWDGRKTDSYTFGYKQPLTLHTTEVGGETVREVSYPKYYLDQLPEIEIIKQHHNGKTLTAEITREYDPKGNLLSEALPMRGTARYTYDDGYSLPLSKVCPKDADTTILEQYTLRSDGKAAEWKKIFEKSGGVEQLREAVQYSYDANNNLASERIYSSLNLAPSGGDRVTEYSYQNTNPQLPDSLYNGVYLTGKRCGGIGEGYVYDSHGRMLQKTDGNGNNVYWQYDTLGRTLAESYTGGQSKQTRYMDVENIIIQTDEGGNRKRYSYSPMGKIIKLEALNPDTLLTSWTYDSMNRTVCETAYSGEGNAETKYSYDAFDRVLSKTVTAPGLPDYAERCSYDDAYDPVKLCTKESKTVEGSTDAPAIITATIKDAAGQVTEQSTGSSTVKYSYDMAGNKTSQTDPRDGLVIVRWGCDHAGRVIKEIRQQDTTTEAAATTVYNPLGDKAETVDFDGGRTVYVYDNIGRLTEQRTEMTEGVQAVTRYQYDKVGSITEQSTLTGENRWRTVRYSYDSRNRLTRAVQPDGASTEYEYDPLGNKTAVTTRAARTTYSYDRYGNRLTMTDPIGNGPSPTNPQRRTERNEYDLYGRLRRKTDRNGYVTVYSCDSRGRATEERTTDPAGKQPEMWKRYSYHRNGSKAGEENPVVGIAYGYDEQGRLIHQTEVSAQGTTKKTYGYDRAGNRTSFGLTRDGKREIELTYSYDRQNRLKDVRRGGVTLAEYSYDPNGNRTGLVHPQSGISTRYSYNRSNLVTTLVTSKNGSEQCRYTYSYTPDGNQSRKAYRAAGKAEKATDYSYDLCGRLTEEREQEGGRIAYAYDGASNRRQMTAVQPNGKECTTEYSYDLRNRLLTEIRKEGETTEQYQYSYDYNGNQLQRRRERYERAKGRDCPGRVSLAKPKDGQTDTTLEIREYNSSNELIRLYRDTEVTTYSYRPDGLRHSKQREGITTHHMWDGQEMAAECTNGSVTARYLRGTNLIAREQDNQLQYYLHNAHGDVTERTDQNGTRLKVYSYDAFGNEQNREPLDSNPFRYCGEYYDKEGTGYYLGARSYEPETGRFTGEDTHWNTGNMIYGDNPGQWHNLPADQEDRLGLNKYTHLPDNSAIVQSGNRYVYCVNDPVKYVDRNGRFISTVIGAVTGGLIGGVFSAVQGNGFWSGAISGAVGGAIAGFGVDLAVTATAATGGAAAILLPMLSGGFGSGVSNLLGQIFGGANSVSDVDWSSLGFSILLGSVFNAGAFGLTTLGNMAFGTVLKGTTIMNRLVEMLYSAPIEYFLSSWFATFFTGLPQATIEYIASRKSNKEPPHLKESEMMLSM